MDTIALRQRFSKLEGARDILLSQHDSLSVEAAALTTKFVNIEKAQLIIQAAAKLTQEQLSYRVSELVTLALAQVFDDPYELVLRFENKRGRTEAILLFKDSSGQEIEPMEASGGGAWDVASFALRVALWSLEKPRSRATLILDEPFKFLHGEGPQRRVSEMLKDLSTRLHMQFIIVTQEEWGAEFADRVFKVTRRNKQVPSKVEMV